MAKYVCKSFKIVVGKKGRLRGRKIKRCRQWGVKGKVKGGLYKKGKIRKKARRVK